MKLILTVLVLVGVIFGGIALTKSDKVSYKSITVTEEVEVFPEWYEADCPECQEAYEATKRKKELEAELNLLKAEVDERESRIEEIEKELGTY